MIGISKLYLVQAEPSDALRYHRQAKQLPSHLLQFSIDKKPVVVWNMTRRCNLQCTHCYASADSNVKTDELTTLEGKALIDDLAAFGSAVLLFSGGEPTMREDLPELAEYAVQKGMRAVISTNGMRIDQDYANRLKTIGLSYVGISLDGPKRIHDQFRKQVGAFEAALAGVKACQAAGLKVGLRHTITKDNFEFIPQLFDLIEKEQIPRICFYHLVQTGRASEYASGALSHQQTREVLDLIIDRTVRLHELGQKVEVLTVDNHADAAYLYLRMARENHPHAAKALELLRMNGGSSTGHGIGCVSWDGTVYPDQFWRTKPLGNVKDRKFGEIWTDQSNALLMQLKDKKAHVTGRCQSCRFLDICGGNFRARAEAFTNEVWGVDPACYLTDKEISGNLE